MTSQNGMTMQKVRSLVAFMSGYTDGDVCPLCDSDSIIMVSTTTKLDIRGFGPLTVKDWHYAACENPECGFEFVGPEQARHNESRITVEKVLQRA